MKNELASVFKGAQTSGFLGRPSFVTVLWVTRIDAVRVDAFGRKELSYAGSNTARFQFVGTSWSTFVCGGLSGFENFSHGSVGPLQAGFCVGHIVDVVGGQLDVVSFFCDSESSI